MKKERSGKKEKKIDSVFYIFSMLLDASGGVSLVSLFNCVSTFMGYLMPKPSLKKNNSSTI